MAELQLTLDRGYAYPGSPAALAPLRLACPAGAFTALIGPSGCGKSTVLNLIAGLRPLRGGRLTGVEALGPLALMFQQPRLMPWLDVAHNLALVDDGSADFGHRAATLLERVGLGERTAAFPGELSGGMQRRVALARAFAVRPRLLLMDEPFVSLDEPNQQRLRALLLDLCQHTQPTVVFVTHQLDEALQLADRVVFFSAAPGRAILDYPLRGPRPRAPAAVEAERRALLAAHPHLLSGRCGR